MIKKTENAELANVSHHKLLIPLDNVVEFQTNAISAEVKPNPSIFY